MVSSECLLDSLRRTCEESLGKLLSPGIKVALVGFPNHWNAGDSAIWIGEQLALAKLGCQIIYQCTWNDYDYKLLNNLIGDSPILIHGGGNLGDLWPNHQVFRERIISDFPRNQVIQLPQSLCFTQEVNLLRFQRLVAGHTRLTFMLRDRISFERACELFEAPSLLVPDMAFCLGPQFPPNPASDGIIPVFWLSRTDKESAISNGQEVGMGCLRQDWLEPVDGDQVFWSEAKRLHEQLRHGQAKLSEKLPNVAGLATIVEKYEALGRLRLQRGLWLLARGRVVVTDRLHGHILSLCLGRPHVLLDARYRKLRSFHETWTSQSSITHWAASPDEALKIARELYSKVSQNPEKANQ